MSEPDYNVVSTKQMKKTVEDAEDQVPFDAITSTRLLIFIFFVCIIVIVIMYFVREQFIKYLTHFYK